MYKGIEFWSNQMSLYIIMLESDFLLKNIKRKANTSNSIPLLYLTYYLS